MTKEERRLAMPQTTKWLDETRAAFGEPVGIRAEENGHSVAWGTLKFPVKQNSQKVAAETRPIS